MTHSNITLKLLYPLTSACVRRADLFEDDEVSRLLKFSPWWTKLSPSTEQEGEAGELKLKLNPVGRKPFNSAFVSLSFG